MNNIVFCHVGGFGESTLHVMMPCFGATYHKDFFVRCKSMTPRGDMSTLSWLLAAWIRELNISL